MTEEMRKIIEKVFISGCMFGSKMCRDAILNTDPIKSEDINEKAQDRIKTLISEIEGETSKWQQKRDALARNQ